jgi:tetratricopeptide (TPR) repeat protein
MSPEDLIAERFEIERRAGAGGMGEVYQAHDRRTGERVALKVLHRRAALEEGRFMREAEVLSALSHPSIVRYLGHGQTAAGAPYLAMEWLEGETLSARLSRAGLTIGESVALGARVAEALGEAHRHGVVHRDLKPSNLFLRGGSIGAPALIDFGIARMMRAGGTLTTPGAMVGTPGYMAPEQARGESAVGPRADVFSLGCVLFKCLSGRPPFEGDDALAVMLKVVLEEPPLLSELRPEIPEALSDLVARMLSKTPEQRPADGAAIAAELAALGEIEASVGRAPAALPAPEITIHERRVMCLVVARWGSADAETTLSDTESHARDDAIYTVVKRQKGQIELLADGSILVVLTSAEAATDLAARAARCALALEPLLFGATMAVVSGRALLAARLPVGELIDRAVTLLGDAPPSIRVDEVTAGLLGARFELGADAAGATLVAELRAFETTRTLLGKPTPCVGREPELGLLSSIVARSIEEGTAAAVLVTAPAGMGKSRLQYELIRRLRERGEAVEVWMGRGDPLTAGSAFSLLGQALRGAAGIVEGEPLEVRRRRLRARVARYLGGDPVAQGRIATFLGELVGTPFPAEDNVQLLSARRDPRLMGDQIRRAFEEFVAAACAAHPVLLVLEDLHWGDLPTVKLVDAALRNLRDQPLIVLSLARPEVHTLFPDLWVGRPVQVVQLGELGRRACERLVRLSLGEDVSAETVQATVGRAFGNAFYLEELIRAVARGDDGSLPESVLSMVQARLEGFDVEARRVLRAASIFGMTFWAGGVSALLGGADVIRWLGFLTEREVIFPRGEGAVKFPGEGEYSFRHALVHEAAYGMLTERDRAVGHKLAGAWLEQAGEGEAGLLGEHFERGGELGRARAFYRLAAEQALEGDDHSEALRWAERALGGAPKVEDADAGAKEEIGVIRRIQAEAHYLRGEFALAEPHALEARSLLPRGSEPWFGATSELMLLCSRFGRTTELCSIGAELCDLWSPEAKSAQLIAMARSADHLVFCGEYGLADELLARIETALRATNDPRVKARGFIAMATRALVQGDIGRHQELTAAAVEQLVAAGDRRGACNTRITLGYAHTQLGAWEEAEQKLRDALAVAERMNLPNLADYALHNLGFVLARRGALEEARAIEREAMERSAAQGNVRLAGGARMYLALILAQMGELEAAEQEATIAIEGFRGVPPMHAYALSTRAKILLLQGRTFDALADARQAAQVLTGLGGIDEGEAQVWLTYAEALRAEGDVAAAEAAMASARGRLLARAAKITEPVLRRSFLERVPENAQTLELARAWLGPG